MLFVAQNHAASRAAQRLMRGRGYDFGVRHGRRVLIRGDKPGDVRHVHHQLRANFVCDAAESRKVDDASVCARAGNDDLRTMLFRQPFHFVVVYRLQLAVDAVLHDIVNLRGKVHRCAVRQVSALVEAHAHDGVAGLDSGEVRRHVRLRAAVWLHIRVLRAEQLLGTADGEPFRHIHELAAAVVAPPRVALRVLVREHRTLRLKHRRARVVFGRYQVDIAALPLNLVLNRTPDFEVLFHQ